MPVTIQDLPERIKKAKALNASDEQILESIRKVNPSLLLQAQSLLKQSIAPTPTVQPKTSFVEKAARFVAPKSVENFAQTLGDAAATFSKDIRQAQESQAGLTDINKTLGEKINTMKRLGQDTSRLERQYQENTGQTFDIAKVIPSTQKSTKQIAGEALGTVGTAALGAAPAATIAKRIGFGTLVGAGAGAKTALEQNKTFGEAAKDVAIGAGTGAALSGVLEGLGAALRASAVKRTAENIYTKELQPPTKEVAQEIERGFKTFGDEVAKVTNDAGKPVYVGSHRTLVSKAKGELETVGKKLMSKADDFADTSFTRDEVAGDIVQKLKDQYSILDKRQLDIIKEEVKRIPRLMNPEELINTKRMVDGLIPDSAWSKLNDPALAFPAQVRYILRDNARRLLNEKIPDAGFQALNNRLSIAMDVKKLAATQLAQTMKKGVLTGGITSTLNNILQRTIFSPSVTTRASQGLLRAGTKTGQTVIRQAGRTGATVLLNKLRSNNE